jgi:hypothetical protein
MTAKNITLKINRILNKGNRKRNKNFLNTMCEEREELNEV